MSDTPITDKHQADCLRSGGRTCSGGRNAYWLARKLERQNGVLLEACADVLAEVGEAYMACKPQLREAVEACNHPGELWDVQRIIELLETLSRYPVATTYPDGPCIESDDMDEIRDILGHNDTAQATTPASTNDDHGNKQ